jgi:hypothetical protein
MLKSSELERYVQLAARSVAPSGALLVLLDGDDDCPVTLAADLLRRVEAERSDLPSGVVVACREFEAWFLAAAPSLAGRRGLPEPLEAPPSPEAVRGAKEWIQARRLDGFAYSPATDQPALAAEMDLSLARSGARSFDKLWREIERLIHSTM